MADKTATLDDTKSDVEAPQKKETEPVKFTVEKVVDDRFELKKELGAGGFGQVFLAHDKKKKEEVALKILQLREMPERQVEFYISTFQSEFSSLTKLRHPNLCNVYDFGKLSGKNLYYFTSEFVSNAQDLLKATKSATLEETIELFTQLCRVVSYVHSHGLVHYDLKPANILVQEVQGVRQIKLVDFGLATPQQATLKATAGSLLYMSPEVLQKERIANRRSDLYAMGVILFQLLTREHPFKEATTKEEIIEAHLKKSPPRLDAFRIDLPPFWQEIVDRLMAKKPAERYSSATTILKTIHLHCHEATEAPTETKEGILSYTFSSELIARGPIQKELQEQLKRVLESQNPTPPATMLLLGERGTGKTRLLEEIKYFAQLAGHHVVHFDDPNRFEGELQRELNIASPSLETTVVFDEDPATEVQGWLSLFLEKSKTAPTLVLVDDLHRFPKKAHLFLEKLLQAQKVAFLSQAPLRVVLVASTLEKNPWNLADFVALHTLKNFTEPDVALYLKSFTGLSTVRPEITRKFYGATSGNPFFLTEILKSLIVNNLLFDPSGLDFGTHFPIPTSVTEVLKERFLKLPPRTAEVAALIAASSIPLSTTAIAELTSQATKEVDESLELLKGEDVNNLSFQQGVREACDPEKWKELHRKLARYVAKTSPKENYFIAFHFMEGGEPKEAATHALDAAEEFRLGGNLEKETTSLTWTLKGLSPDDSRTRVARRRLSQIYGLEGNYPKGETLIEEQLRSSPPNDAEGARDLKTAGWLALKQKKYDAALDFFQKARDRLGDRKHSFDTALLNDIGNVYLLTRKYPEAEKAFRESFDSLQKSPLLFPMDLMNNKLAVVYNLLGREEESTRFLEGKIKLFEQNETKNKITLAMTESELGYLLMRQGKFAEAIPHLEACLKSSEENRFLHNIIKTLFNLTQCYENQSRYAEAMGYAQKELHYASQLGTVEDVASSSLSVATLYATLGVYPKAEPLFKKALDLFGSTPLMEAWTRLSLAGLYSETERYQEAKEAVSQAMKKAHELKDNDLKGNLLYAEAEIALAEGNKSSSEKSLRAAEEIFKGRGEDDMTLRLAIVRVKLSSLEKKEAAAADLARLEKASVESPETQIEAWLTLARYWEKEKEKSKTFREKARERYEEVKKNLPEEYHDTFRSQKRFASLQ